MVKKKANKKTKRIESLEELSPRSSLEERFRRGKDPFTFEERLERWKEIRDSAIVVLEQALLRAGDIDGASKSAADQARSDLKIAEEHILRLSKKVKKKEVAKKLLDIDNLLFDIFEDKLSIATKG